MKVIISGYDVIDEHGFFAGGPCGAEFSDPGCGSYCTCQYACDNK